MFVLLHHVKVAFQTQSQAIWRDSLVISLLLFSLVGGLDSCKKDDAGPSLPIISDFSPTSGVAGTSVTINGSNFSPSTSSVKVKFGGVDAIVSAATSTQLTVTVPETATSGTISITNDNGASVSSSTSFAILTPAITNFSPTSGVAGTSVTISGSNFSPSTAFVKVKFGGVDATVSATTSTQLTVIVPENAVSGPISVSNGGSGAPAVSSANFTILAPVITSFLPTSGVAGTSVTISGSNFSSSPSLVKVKFGSLDAMVSAATSTQLTVTVPQMAVSGPISVANGNGTPVTSSTNFIILAPVITSFSPTIGSAGVSVVITGDNFSTNPAYNVVKFNGVNATVSNSTSTQITAIAPTSVSAGKLSVTVGPNMATSANDFAICNGIELLLSNVVITSIGAGRNSFNYSFDLTNVGSNAAALTSANSTIQSFVSANDTFDGSDVPAGGFGLQTTINSAQVYNGSSSASLNVTVDNYPYFILRFTTTLAECDNTISHTVIKRIIP